VDKTKNPLMGVFLFVSVVFIVMAKSHKSLPKKTSRKTIIERNKRLQNNLDILNKLSEKL